MPARERMRLTDPVIARLRPREKEYTVWDSRVPGLGVRVRPSGGQSHVMLRDAGGRSKRVSLGPVSLKSIAEVRREYHVLAAEPDGEDEPREAFRAAPAFEGFVAGAWKEAHFDRCKPWTQRGVRYVLSGVNGGGIMLQAERPVGPVAAAQKCATHVPLSVRARGGGCTAWSLMRRFDWRLSRRV